MRCTVCSGISSYIEFNNDFYEVNIIKNSVSGMVSFKYGNVLMNNIQTVLLFDETLDSQSTTEKILISNNTISYILGIFNNNYKFVVSNNNLKHLSVKRWNSESSVKNKIINNQFSDGAIFHMSWGDVPYYNIMFTSNKFLGTCSFYSDSTNFHMNSGNFNWYDSTSDYRFNFFSEALLSNKTSNQSIYYPNPSVPGTFEWSYNGIDFTCPTPNSSQPLSLIKVVGSTNDIDGGNPNHDYYDIDLTVNDRGVNGGPYSQLNYNAANPNNSKAFIFDLEMPTDLFPGQSVDIKAKGYHKN